MPPPIPIALCGHCCHCCSRQWRFCDGRTGATGLDIGRLFEERSTLGAQAAIEQMLSLQAKENAFVDGQPELCSIDALRPGDHIRIRVGRSSLQMGRYLRGFQAPDTSFPERLCHNPYKSEIPVFAGMVNLGAQIDVAISDWDPAEPGENHFPSQRNLSRSKFRSRKT